MGKIVYEPKGRALEYAELAANIYSGCTHGCKYCFAPSVLHRDRGEFHSTAIVREGALVQLEKDVKKLDGDPRRILMSFTTDPFQPEDMYQGATRKALQIIKNAGLNVEILTKGSLRALKDFDLLDENDCIAVTLTCDNEADSKEWEPYAAPPEERIELLKSAHRRGIQTWVSCEPVLYPSQTLNLIQLTHTYVNLFKVGKLNYHAHAKTIDWKKFGHDAVELLERLGAEYYLKTDLKGCMEK